MSNSFEEAHYNCFKLCSFIVNEMFMKDGGKYSPQKVILWPFVSASPAFAIHFSISWVISGLIGAHIVFVLMCVWRPDAERSEACFLVWLKASFRACFSIIKLGQLKWHLWSNRLTQITFTLWNLLFFTYSCWSPSQSSFYFSHILCSLPSSPAHRAGLRRFGFSRVFHV